MHLKNQENMTQDQERKWSIEAVSEMIQILELSDRDFQIILYE